MNPKSLKRLNDINACRSGIEWAKQHPSLKVAWEKCERPDWMLWYLDKVAPLEKGMSVRLAIAFAERVIDIFENRHPKDNRPRKAIEAAKAWAESPTEENRLKAREASAYAAADAADAAAAAYAADAAAYAAAAASDASAAVYAAAAAAYAADADAAAAAAADADAYARQKGRVWRCDLIRSLVKNPCGDE